MVFRHWHRTSVLLCTAFALNLAAPVFAQNADEFDGPPDEFTLDTALRQRRLQGEIQSVNPAQGSLIINAIGISYPSGKMRKLDLPQPQVITGNSKTRLYVRGQADVPVHLNELKKGDKAIAIGVWQENQNRWMASQVAVWSRREGQKFVLDGRANERDDDGSAFPDAPMLPDEPENDCIPAPPGLVGWWRGEIDTRDYAGHNDGRATGILDFVPGVVGQAFVFDGDKTSLRIPKNDALPIGDAPRTVEFWMFTIPESWKTPIFDWGNGRDRSIFGLTTVSYPILSFWTRGGIDIKFSAAGDSVVGWRHIALTYDGKKTFTAYVNGKVSVVKELPGPLNTTATDITIGGTGLHDWYFIGALDEFSIYNRALTAEEIVAIYEAGDGGKCLPGQARKHKVPIPGAKQVSWPMTRAGNQTLRKK